MRGSGWTWGLVAALAVVHFLLRLGFGIGGWAPDLLTVGLLVGARGVGVGTGAGVGFAFGVLEDAFSILAFGANTVAMTLVGALGAQTRDLFVGESVQFYVGYLVVGKWTRDLIHWGLQGEAIRGNFVQSMVIDALPSALYAALVGTFVLTLVGVVRESER